MAFLRIAPLIAALALGASGAVAAPPVVVSTSPVSNGMAPTSTAIAITFDQPLMKSSVTASTLRVFAKQTGKSTGALSFSNGDMTVTFTPSKAFSAGELVLVNLSHDIQAADSTPLRSAGYAFQFLIATRSATRSFDVVQSMSNRSGSQTEIYGAAAADLNRDGFIDLATVNEVSADVRVFLNKADGSGTYGKFLAPFSVGVESSPNETGDFDNDGKMDLAVSSTHGGAVWILRGAGNGKFSGSQTVPTGAEAHGIAVLDVDGDADLDIVDALAGDNEMAVLLNNGSGTFSAPTYFDSGCDGEWGLASGDLNNDGIIDLVVGCVGDHEVAVMLGNGTPTFDVLPAQDASGPPWQVTLGDLDGDGDLDATLALADDGTSTSGGGLLFGDGDGTFGAATHVDDAHTPATDVGDFDGDGDLDWLLSGFAGGLWKLYVNDGDGNFTFDQEFAATNNPSCAVLLDIDNDGDLDMALTDEVADTVTVLQNETALSALCPPTPAECRTSVKPGKSSFVLKDKSKDKGDALVWKWVGGAATPKSDFGDPLGSDDFALCVYDQGALLTSMTADHGGLCKGKPCWKEKSTSFTYSDKVLTPTGAQKLKLVQGLTDGKAKITVSGKGALLLMPDLAGIAGPVDVQLQRSGGAPCFGSTFSAPFKRSDATMFKDKAD